MVSEGRRAQLLRCVLAIIFSSLIAIRALRRKSLDRSGAAAGFLVVAFHLAASYRYLMQSSSSAVIIVVVVLGVFVI